MNFVSYTFDLDEAERSLHDALCVLTETVKELTETKVMAKKLGEGVKKYKAALTNLKTVLSSTED